MEEGLDQWVQAEKMSVWLDHWVQAEKMSVRRGPIVLLIVPKLTVWLLSRMMVRFILSLRKVVKALGGYVSLARKRDPRVAHNDK